MPHYLGVCRSHVSIVGVFTCKKASTTTAVNYLNFLLLKRGNDQVKR